MHLRTMSGEQRMPYIRGALVGHGPTHNVRALNEAIIYPVDTPFQTGSMTDRYGPLLIVRENYSNLKVRSTSLPWDRAKAIEYQLRPHAAHRLTLNIEEEIWEVSFYLVWGKGTEFTFRTRPTAQFIDTITIKTAGTKNMEAWIDGKERHTSMEADLGIASVDYLDSFEPPDSGNISIPGKMAFEADEAMASKSTIKMMSLVKAEREWVGSGGVWTE